MEEASMKLMHDVADEAQPGARIAVLSGPTFAHEVAIGLPAAVTLAIEDREVGEALGGALPRPNFRPYFSDDAVGPEIGGAAQKLPPIPSGWVAGGGPGPNARSGAGRAGGGGK